MNDVDLAVATVAASDVEAAAIVSALADGGIEAKAAPSAPAWTGRMPISNTARGVPVLVREADLQRARELIAENVTGSAEIDWDEVDVGERVDNVPLRPVGNVPVLARIAWAVAVTIVFAAGLAFILALIF